MAVGDICYCCYPIASLLGLFQTTLFDPFLMLFTGTYTNILDYTRKQAFIDYKQHPVVSVFPAFYPICKLLRSFVSYAVLVY